MLLEPVLGGLPLGARPFNSLTWSGLQWVGQGEDWTGRPLAKLAAKREMKEALEWTCPLLGPEQRLGQRYKT